MFIVSIGMIPFLMVFADCLSESDSLAKSLPPLDPPMLVIDFQQCHYNLGYKLQEQGYFYKKMIATFKKLFVEHQHCFLNCEKTASDIIHDCIPFPVLFNSNFVNSRYSIH